MGITFLHSADWHLGRRFRAFEASATVALDAARLAIVERLASAAETAGARHVLVAGDVFDRDDVDDKLLRQVIERLRRHASIRWWLLPGNHDPAKSGGVWSRLAEIGLPANVVVATSPAAIEIEPRVVLLPAPLTSRVSATDPTDWFDRHPTAPDVIRIGLAHGSTQEAFGTTAVNVPIDRHRDEKARLDYLALGDWHGVRRVGPRIAYPGTPEPDSFDDNGQGHALIVRIEAAGALPEITTIDVAAFGWDVTTVSLTSAADVSALDAVLSRDGRHPERRLLRLFASGHIDGETASAFAAWRARAEAAFHVLELDTTGLHVEDDREALSRLDADPHLAPVVARLKAIAGSDASNEATVARMALTKLVAHDRKFREAAE